MKLYKSGYTQNRELSWLRYNERVLDEALDETVPLFERLNYIAIFMSNLEEFVQVRVGGLIGEDEIGDDEKDDNSGMTAGEQLDAIYSEIDRLLEKKDEIQAVLELELERNGMIRAESSNLDSKDSDRVREFYKTKIEPYIRTHIVRKPKEFPELNQYKTYIVCRLDADSSDIYGVIDIPEALPQICILNEGMPVTTSFVYEDNLRTISRRKRLNSFRYILTEDIIKMYASELFLPFEVAEIHSIDIARNAEILNGKNSGNMLKDMKDLSFKRKTAAPDKIIVDGRLSRSMSEFLMNAFRLNSAQLFTTTMIDYGYVQELEKCMPQWIKTELCFPEFESFNQLRIGYGPVIDRLRKKEILCCYPYDTMDPLLELLKESTVDPRVTEIRMTIYRLASHPKIVEYLEKASLNGKKVSVVMELRARFDEDNNIDWSEEMRSKGINVYFGSKKYKVHSKLAQIVLNEQGRTTFITHLSTGNFNEKTASKYTDIALITYDQRIGKSADKMWKDIIKGNVSSYNHIMAAPADMKSNIIELIRREAAKGREGRIFIKVNSVTDVDIIEELKKASCNGCSIKLIVRGICCILPGIKDCTENIDVVNVVGRYLEHSRVYIFGTDDDEIMYISSADLMTRNMSKRVELACPIYNANLRSRIKAIMLLNYLDNVKGRRLDSRGRYIKKTVSDKLIDSQNLLMNES